MYQSQCSGIREKLVLTILALSTLGFTTSTKSEVIYSNFGIGDSFSTSSGWAINYQNPPQSSQSIAFSFITPELVSPELFVRVDSIDLAIASLSTTGSADFTVAIYTDSANSPDVLLGSASGAAPLGPAPASITTIDFPALSAPGYVSLGRSTQYWIGLHPENATATSLVWWWNELETGLQSTYYDSQTNANVLVGGNWENTFTGAEPAYRVNAQLFGIDTVAVVPVPATVWLFGSGLIGLLGMARCKKA